MADIMWEVVEENARNKVIKWTLANTDVGLPYELSGRYPTKSVTMTGTWGVGGEVKVYGGNGPPAGDNFQLHDYFGNLLTLTADGGQGIAENTNYLYPSCTGGDGTTALDVFIAMSM